MEMRGGFMRPPRDRVTMMRPGFPIRGRAVMGMERVRLGPPLRPGLIRGVPPVPFGRGMVLPPHTRPRGMGPVMLPRHPLPPPGALGPLGPRGMLPRPILPPRPPIAPDSVIAKAPSSSINGGSVPGNNQFRGGKDGGEQNHAQDQQNNNPNKNNKTGNRGKGVNVGGNQQQHAGGKKPRKDNKNRRGGNVIQPAQQMPPQQIPIQTQPSVPMGQSPLQNLHTQHHPQQHPSQNTVNMNPPQMQKHLPSVQPQMTIGLQQQPQQQLPMQQQVVSSGRNNYGNQRTLGQIPVGRTGMVNNVPAAAPNDMHNVVVNRGVTNIPPGVGMNPHPARNNSVISGSYPVQYSTAPPTSYAVPPPAIGHHMPIKRGPPQVAQPPPVLQPKRIRYDSPNVVSGYAQYQQQPPPQQTVYTSYDMPPPTEVYSNAPPPTINVAPPQNYNTTDYNNYQVVPQTSSPYSTAVSTQYSTSYNNTGSAYTTYSTPSGYDSNVDYSSVAVQQVSATNTDPYGYSKPVSTVVDPYAYSNPTYTNTQPVYDEYSNTYVDTSGYNATTVQDPTYGQSVGTYANYSY